MRVQRILHELIVSIMVEPTKGRMAEELVLWGRTEVQYEHGISGREEEVEVMYGGSVEV